MKLIFEKGAPGQHLDLLPSCDVPEVSLSQERKAPLPCFRQKYWFSARNT